MNRKVTSATSRFVGFDSPRAKGHLWQWKSFVLVVSSTTEKTATISHISRQPRNIAHQVGASSQSLSLVPQPAAF